MLKRSLNLVSLLQTLIYSCFFFFSSYIIINFQLQTRRKRKTITSLPKVGIIIIIIIIIILMMMMMMMMTTMMMMIIMRMTVLIITKFKFDTKKIISSEYRKIPKISPGAYIFQRPCLRGLSMEGNLRFTIDWVCLIFGRKLTVFALF